MRAKSPDRYPYASGYGEPQAEGSRTPYDSRGGSPVDTGEARPVAAYDSTLPSAGLEALSAVGGATGRQRRRSGPAQEQGLDLAVRMESLAPRKGAGVGGSLGSLINAYDQVVGGPSRGERKNANASESEFRISTGNALPDLRADVDVQQNLISDALGNSNSRMDQLHWGTFVLLGRSKR